MPLDPALLRSAEGIAHIRSSQEKRFANHSLLDSVLLLDAQRRSAQFALEQARKGFGLVQKRLGKLFMEKDAKRNEEREALQKELEMLEGDIKMKEQTANVARNEFTQKFEMIGNLVADEAFVSNNEDENPVVKEVKATKLEGEKGELIDDENRFVFSHHEVLEGLGGYDAARGAAIAGHRGYFLTGCGVQLNLALINYGLQFLSNRSCMSVFLFQNNQSSWCNHLIL